jgi:transcriptional regulator with XRE-family HTH domain
MASYVGSKVRTRRLRQGWTQHQLASYAGITTEQVSRIERDLVQPRWKTIIRLADALDIDWYCPTSADGSPLSHGSTS